MKLVNGTAPQAAGTAAQRLRYFDPAADMVAAANREDARRKEAVRGAHADGVAVGERIGYRLGWYWGLVCGVCVGTGLAIAIGAAWVAMAWPLPGRG
jgi:hypothetical protein